MTHPGAEREVTGEHDVVVIGGGAAGLSAALVFARARLRVVVVDAGAPRNAPADHVHGFLTRDGVPPGELVARGRAEVAGYGGELVDGVVEAVLPGFQVRLAGGRTLTARRLLLATGVRDELPAVAGLEARWGRDVLHCPYCHGYEVRDGALGVLATQPRSVQQALMLRQWSDDVVLFEHVYPLSDAERERLAAREVRVVPGEVTELLVRDDRLCGVATVDGSDVVPRTALFVAPGFAAAGALVDQLGCATDAGGSVVVDATGATSVPGVWAAGNLVAPMAQVITAAGAATAAAIALHHDLVAEDVERALQATAA